MPNRNLYTDAQAIVALTALRPNQLRRLTKADSDLLRKAKAGVESAANLRAKAIVRENDTYTVYEPVMEWAEDSTPETRFERIDKGVWAAEGFTPNAYATRDETKVSPLTIAAMREQADALLAFAVTTPVKRALARI